MKSELDVTNLILNNFIPQEDYHEKIKMYMLFNKHECAYNLIKSNKYKNDLICMLALYKDIKDELVSEISKIVLK